MVNFLTALRKANAQRGFLICGLDPIKEKLPKHVIAKWNFNQTQLLLSFLIPIIDAVAPHVAGFKPNLSFFLNFDDAANSKFWGQEALQIICKYIRRHYPDHLLILDAKDGDIGASNSGYFRRAFDGYDAHAVTWDPYLGTAIREQLKEYRGRGVIALARTSNPEGTQFQTAVCKDGRPVYMHNIDQWLALWNDGFPIGLVAGATHPDELSAIRRRVGAMPLLVPGVGKQGGDAVEASRRGFGGRFGNIMINQSSTFLYASSDENFAKRAGEVAREDQLRIKAAS